MKLNNKGITLIEIIISVALIAVVLVFLFTLLIQVNNENDDNEVRAAYLVNQSAFIKQIEEDFIEYTLTNGTFCLQSDISTTNSDANLYLPKLDGNVPANPHTSASNNIKCLKFTFNDSEPAYLFLYKRKEATPLPNGATFKTILSYYRNDFKQSVELEDFDWDLNKYSATTYYYYNSSASTPVSYTYSYSLPIIGPDLKDYSINLSYGKIV